MKNTSKKILLFGGSFNPPTVAHLAVIRACLADSNFAEIWIMPSGNRLDKQYTTTDTQRLNMLRLVKQGTFHNDPRLIISDFELKLPLPSETWNTVQALKQAYPSLSFHLLFGSDSYQDMPNWKNGSRLRHEHQYLVIDREGYPLPKNSDLPKLKVVSSPKVSSTEVRRKVYQQQPYNDLVTPLVADYIRRQKLYL